MRHAILLLLLLCCGPARAAAVSPTLAPTAPPAVAARFETTHCAIPCKKPISRQWHLLRDSQTIELRGDGAPFSELWRRLGDGRADYVYVMHDERRAIEYSPVDLVLIGRQPDWTRIGALLSPADLERLKRGAAGRHAGLATRRYTGTLGPARIDVAWIPNLALPARLQYRYPDQTVTIRLLRRYEGASPVASTTAGTLAGYQLVDYADIGDMEEDAQAQAWIRKAAAAPGHLHQGHGH
ncbi:hypothetical protein [Thiobacillus denitrificans]|uniref:hypothetical protein n=1 Tax=Thiobacillus denitrificans TaxID=36861 RepID=UPI000758B1D3|nr:hypothetical protein [Thiobacillus denitrificans]